MLLRVPALLALLSSLAAADVIQLADGTRLENVQVVNEGLKEVSYREGRSDKTVASDLVARVEYEKKPQAIDEAEGFLLEEDLGAAGETLDDYVQTQIDKPGSERQFKWAPPYAAWQAVSVYMRAGDLESARNAAAKLIANYPESRYRPLAYLAKADAERQMGNAGAKKTLTDLGELIAAQGLGKRWELECRLGQVLVDAGLKPESRRNELERISSDAKDQPSVRLRAQVAVGESYLEEAATSPAKAKDLRGKARATFEKVVEDPKADASALAGGHAGLGESLFLSGADTDDKELLGQATLHFLRVATLYRDQGVYVARSLFYAMRCFDLMRDGQRKADMRRQLASRYPGSPWTEEARKY